MDNTPLTDAELAEAQENQQILRDAMAKHGKEAVVKAVQDGMREERTSRK